MLAAGPLREYTLRCPTGFGEADHGMTTGRGRSPARAAWVRSSEVEHLTFNQEVPGSIPGAPTKMPSTNNDLETAPLMRAVGDIPGSWARRSSLLGPAVPVMVARILLPAACALTSLMTTSWETSAFDRD